MLSPSIIREKHLFVTFVFLNWACHCKQMHCLYKRWRSRKMAKAALPEKVTKHRWMVPQGTDCTNMDNSSQATITTPSSMSFSKVFPSTILCAIFLTNFLGNTCTCLVVFHARSLRERPSSLLLSSLAVCDLFALLLPLLYLILLYDLQAACNVFRYFMPLVPALLFTNIVHICKFAWD